MAISQKDLAAQLGISQMTVSRALRGNGNVREDLRRQIVSMAKARGYPVKAQPASTPDFLHVICSIVCVGNSRGADQTGFNQRILNGLQAGAREWGSEVLNYSQSPKTWPHVVNRRQVDGVIHLYGGDDAFRPQYDCPLPWVTIFCPVANADVVTIDNLDGGRQLGDYLGRHGHRRVAYVGPQTELAEERLLGLQAGLRRHGGDLPTDLIRLQKHAAGPDDAMKLTADLLDTPGRSDFTAIAVYNDYMAAGLIEQLQARGIRVPQDLSVVAFDNVALPGYLGPQLTTCAIPLEDLGAEAIRMLYWRIQHPQAPRRKLVLAPDLVAGATVADRKQQDSTDWIHQKPRLEKPTAN